MSISQGWCFGDLSDESTGNRPSVNRSLDRSVSVTICNFDFWPFAATASDVLGFPDLVRHVGTTISIATISSSQLFSEL